MSSIFFVLWLLLLASTAFAVFALIKAWLGSREIDREIALLSEAIERLERQADVHRDLAKLP